MESRALEIELLYAKDLNNVNLITKMDVYVVVSISGGDKNSKQKTKSSVDHVGDANPTWNFLMKFTVDEVVLHQNGLTLDFKLVCERALGDKDIGEVNVPIKELLDSPAKGEGKQILSYQVRKPSGKPKGQLTFAYKFGDKTAAALPYATDHVLAHPPGKVDGEPIAAYPAGSSVLYPPPHSGVYPPPHLGVYPPPVAAYSAGASSEAGGSYPPPAGYPPVTGAPPPVAYPPLPPSGYGYPPPPSPPPHPGYAYPPQPGYAYPPQPGYGYPPQPVQQQPKNNKFGLGLGAGLLGGAVGGLLVGDMISDAADFDCGGGFDF